MGRIAETEEQVRKKTVDDGSPIDGRRLKTDEDSAGPKKVVALK
jgi:hypothetical protein